MTVPWGKIAAFGSLLTLVAVAPYLLGMGSILSNASIQTADIEGTYRIMNLAVGAVKAIIPLTVVGAFVFIFFQFSEAQA
jgi:hypothetical protein